MIDYMHPLVLLQTNLLAERNSIAESNRYITDLRKRLKLCFESTILYKELKEKYKDVELENIDEDETHIEATNYDFSVTSLFFNTQDIAEKLK